LLTVFFKKISCQVVESIWVTNRIFKCYCLAKLCQMNAQECFNVVKFNFQPGQILVKCSSIEIILVFGFCSTGCSKLIVWITETIYLKSDFFLFIRQNVFVFVSILYLSSVLRSFRERFALLKMYCKINNFHLFIYSIKYKMRWFLRRTT